GETSGRRMRSACAVGLPGNLIDHLDLSYERGIGGFLAQSGRILRRDEPSAIADEEIQKEFQVLGAKVAVPILDRQTMMGVALFDDRVTGEPLLNSELESIFHLLEGLALAVRNIWLHDQMASHGELLAGVLRELSNACVVGNCSNSKSRPLTCVSSARWPTAWRTKSAMRSSRFQPINSCSPTNIVIRNSALHSMSPWPMA